MVRQKKIFNNLNDTLECWLSKRQTYGTFKYKGARELTFIKDFLFMGNSVIGYRHPRNGAVFIYKDRSWYISSSQFGMYKSGTCLRKRLNKIYKILKEKEIKRVKINFTGQINDFSELAFTKMIERHAADVLPEQFASSFHENYDREDYWRKHEFKALNKSFASLELINKTGEWKIPSGLSKEQESQFELDKMMYVLAGEDISDD